MKWVDDERDDGVVWYMNDVLLCVVAYVVFSRVYMVGLTK